jgi:hypothetical protein
MTGSRIHAAFSIHGTFEPDVAAAVLGLAPTRVWRAGDHRVPDGSGRHEAAGLRIEIPPCEASGVEDPIARLLSILRPHREEIVQYLGAHTLRAELSCVVYATSEVPALSLTAELVREVALLQAAIDFDVILTE